MTLTIIGHLCKDLIHLPGKEEAVEESFGGIMFTLLTLANLMGERDCIQPVFGVGQADYDALMEQLSPYKNVDVSGIYKFKGPTNQVQLFYQQDAKTRVECSKNISASIPFNRIKPYLDGDGVLINMISGSDITLETLGYIRMEVRERGIPIHFDFHSLTLGTDQEFKRFRRSITDWRRWCFMLNTIQMSEEEALGLSAERYDEKTLTNHMMPLMVETLLITRSERGVTVIVQDIHKKLTQKDIAGVSFGPTVDATGCGDVFGAAFLYNLLKSKDSFIAAEFANKAAALNATFQGTRELQGLRAKLEQLGVTPAKPGTNGKNANGSKPSGNPAS
ncbi:MAG: carbohydrate kinase family protein [Ignavibacteriae bacterium]|nr:MAG: carbohydrate kinase family protein [Ignavibacteriota bacterium]